MIVERRKAVLFDHWETQTVIVALVAADARVEHIHGWSWLVGPIVVQTIAAGEDVAKVHHVHRRYATLGVNVRGEVTEGSVAFHHFKIVNLAWHLFMLVRKVFVEGAIEGCGCVRHPVKW